MKSKIIICIFLLIIMGASLSLQAQHKTSYISNVQVAYSGQSISYGYSNADASTYLMPYNQLSADHPIFYLDKNGLQYNCNVAIIKNHIGFEIGAFQTNRKMTAIDQIIVQNFIPFTLKQYGCKMGLILKSNAFIKNNAFATITAGLGYHYAQTPAISFIQNDVAQHGTAFPVKYKAIYYAGFQKNIALNFYYKLKSVKASNILAVATLQGVAGNIAIQNTSFSRAALNFFTFNAGFGLALGF
jgi:hypothetical protein